MNEGAPVPYGVSHGIDKTLGIQEIRFSPESLDLIEAGEYEAKFVVLLVGGKSSSGNSSTADGLARLYGISPDRVFHAGDIMRRNHNVGKSIEYIERPDEEDIALDAEIERIIVSATSESPMIIESKNGAAIGRNLRYEFQAAKVPFPEPYLAILKSANQKKRAEIARKKLGLDHLSTTGLQKISSHRDKEDEAKFKKIHPWEEHYTNILDRTARDDRGRPLYDMIINSSSNTADQDILVAHRNLLAGGYVVKKESAPSLPSNSPIPSV